MDQQLYMQAVMFIDRLDKRYAMNRGVGWIYAMRNSAFRKPLLKIGMTSRPPFERAHELGRATGVPGDFDLVYFVHVFARRRAEQLVHQRLESYRTGSHKEFFDVPVSRVVDAFDEAAGRYPVNLDQARPKKRGGWGSEVLPQVFHHIVNPCPHCGQKNKIRGLSGMPLVPIRPRSAAVESALGGLVHAHPHVPVVKLLDQLGIEF